MRLMKQHTSIGKNDKLTKWLALWGVAIAALLNAGSGYCADAWHEGKEYGPATELEMMNAASFGGIVYFGGQPTEKDIATLAEREVKTVINLRSEKEMETAPFDEKAAVEQGGMSYHQMPVGKDPPSEETLAELHKLLDDPANHPMLMHCRSSNRVGFIWAGFRGKQHGLSVEEAIAEGKSAGMLAPFFVENVTKYLEGAEAE